MQSAFAMHNPSQFRVFIYALSVSDDSIYRNRIQGQSRAFRDVSSWSTHQIAQQIVADGIHICEYAPRFPLNVLSIRLNTPKQLLSVVNLNGYTKGSRNDIFAARPAPIQVSMMGFAGMTINILTIRCLTLSLQTGTLAAGWCDYIVTDAISSPPQTSASERWLKKWQDATAGQNPEQIAAVKEDYLTDIDPENAGEDWM